MLISKLSCIVLGYLFAKVVKKTNTLSSIHLFQLGISSNKNRLQENPKKVIISLIISKRKGW